MDLLKKLCWIIIFPVFPLTAQSDSISYIRTFPEKITVRTSYLNTSNNFRITNKEDDLSILLEPNTREYVGISFLFRSVELDLGYSPKFLKENRDNENSKLFTLNFRMFLGKWMQTINFYQQKSFAATLGEEELLLPDVNTLKVGGRTSYIFNPKFSFRAIGFQNEWQLKSAGSFIPSLTYYYTNFDFDVDGYQDQVKSFDIAAGPGYYYNLVIDRNFIISGGGNIGAGVNFSKDETESLTSFLFETNLRAALGYNSEHFFTGINTSFTLLEHSERRTARLDDQLFFFEVYLGYRFDAPKIFMEWADKINSKI